MPYLDHFGLREHPFTLTPNPDLYFPIQTHVNTLASLKFALGRDGGILKVVGEIGTGKTLLCRLLLQELTQGGCETVAYLNAPQHGHGLIVQSVCEEFGLKLDKKANPYTVLSHFLVEQHAAGRRCVLVIDEAQALGRDGLEAVRLLSNLETARNKLLQIVLFGQKELDDLLADKSLPQLRQRIMFSFSTLPLTEAEGMRYLAYRMQKSAKNWNGHDVFAEPASRLIAQQSRGIPRLINILADKALLAAFAAGSPRVMAQHAEEAVADSKGLVPSVPFLRTAAGRRLLRWGVAMPAAAAALVALTLLPADLRSEASQRVSASWRALTGEAADSR